MMGISDTTTLSNGRGRSVPRAMISAIAHYTPPDVLSNDYFEGRLDTTAAWIRERTGIAERRIARCGATSDLIVPAALQCLDDRGICPSEVDCIIVATITPDRVLPSTAAVLQRKIGATRAWGFDLASACSGFVYGLIVASRLVESGMVRRVLLCGADKMTAITNYEDRQTSILFGDAAAVVLIEPSDDPQIGVLDAVAWMDGRGEEHLYMPAGGSLKPASRQTIDNREHTLVQDGPTVFKAAIKGMSSVASEVMARNGLSANDIAWFVPHQANGRILEAVATRLGIAIDRVMTNLDRFGNTCAATIPLCLSEWHRAGRLRVGDALLLASFGAGFTAGSVLLRWAIPAEGACTQRYPEA